MTHSSIRRTGIAVLVALVLAACGSDDDSSSADDTADEATTTTVEAAADDDGASTDDDTSSIPEATGPADESLDPVKIGVINMDEGTPSYPDVSVGIDAGAELVNAELGGIQGRPVEIVHCNVGVDQASNQECAQKFANDDDINLVINGYVFGSGFIFPILDAAGLPVLLQTPLTSPDFQATNGYAYAGGNAGGTVGTAAFAASILDAESIVILGADNDATRSAVEAIEGIPAVEGVDVSTTYISETSADVTADIQASGAADADAVLALINAPQCVQVAQTLQDLEVEAAIISTTTCAVPTTLAESPELFEGWHVVGSGLPPLLAEGESAELDYFRETFPKYGPEEKTQSFLAVGGFGAMLAAWDIGNELPDSLTREDWSTGLAGFTGPYFSGDPELSCPGPHYPAVCSNEVRAYVLDDAGVMSKVEDFFDPLA
ncbi:MAG TPA: ABC transporter substrate-binding protein [Acidimicrobiales bacterium]